MKKINKIAGCAALTLLASCSTPRDITYFQDLGDGQTILPGKVYDIRVRPEDKLSIMVHTQDAELSALFNLVQSQNRLTSSSTSKSAAMSTDSRTSYYTVDDKGDINFPVLGEIHIAGLKRAEVASRIEKMLRDQDLVKQPVVTVEFINTGVSVLGEVAHPGKYEFNNDRMTIMEALALAGDLKMTGKRDNVIVMRENGDRQETYVVDLTNARTLAESPAYYMQQNDVVYVEPNAKSKRETTSAGNTPFNPSFWVSIGSVAISVATLIVSLSK